MYGYGYKISKNLYFTDHPINMLEFQHNEITRPEKCMRKNMLDIAHICNILH